MKVGLIDVDGHNFPNLALMRISAYHKARGDTVEWWWGWGHYDVVYMSKVFSDTYSADAQEPVNADKIIKGGTGYAISLENGREVFHKEAHVVLPQEVECCKPDYSIYPQYDFAVSMTSRGCPNGCGFCHVAEKEGRCAAKVADVADFWSGQKHIEVLDPNITACEDKRDLFKQYRETDATICFNQGLDIRLLNDADIDDINRMRIKGIHFAWDNPAQDLRKRFIYYAKRARHRPHGSYGTVYVLTNFGKCSTEEQIERALFRINALREIGFDPYVMIYDKQNAPQEIRYLQRWCNNKIIFKSEPDFSNYDHRRG